MNTGHVDTAVAAVLVLNRQDVVGSPSLHPFGHGDPSFVFVNVRDAKVAEPRAAFRHQNPLGSANDAESLRIDLRDKQRRSMPEDVIVVGTTACVDEKQTIAMRDSVLLCVVVAQLLVVIELPRLNRLEVQAVFAACDETLLVVADGQKILAAESCQRGFVQTTRFVVDR